MNSNRFHWWILAFCFSPNSFFVGGLICEDSFWTVHFPVKAQLVTQSLSECLTCKTFLLLDSPDQCRSVEERHRQRLRQKSCLFFGKPHSRWFKGNEQIKAVSEPVNHKDKIKDCSIKGPQSSFADLDEGKRQDKTFRYFMCFFNSWNQVLMLSCILLNLFNI